MRRSSRRAAITTIWAPTAGRARGAGQAPAGRATLLAAKSCCPTRQAAQRCWSVERAGVPVTESDEGPRLADPSGNPLVLTLR